MKVLLTVLMVLIGGVALAQMPPQQPQGRQVSCANMTCTNKVDCPIKVQCETDMVALQSAQQAVQADFQNYNQTVMLPEAQKILQQNLAADQANMTAMQTEAKTTTTTSTGATGN